MKALAILIISTFSLLVVNGQNTKQYLIKSGYLKSELTGNTVGTSELWWDDYGAKTCEIEKSVTTTKVFGMKDVDKSHTLMIIVGDKFWSVDYIDNTGTKGTVPYYDESHEMVDDMTEKEIEELSDEILAALGGTKEGTETFKGYKCDVVSLMGARVWTHKGLVLKSEAKVMGIEMNEIFVDFKQNVKHPASRFKAPAGITFEEAPDVTQQASVMGSFNDTKPVVEEKHEEVKQEKLEVVEDSFEKYSKSKFETVVKSYKPKGYKYLTTMAVSNTYVSMLAKGLMGRIFITGISADSEILKSGVLEPFTHNDKLCYYGTNDGKNTLIVVYNKSQIAVKFAATPSMSKAQLLEISDNYKF